MIQMLKKRLKEQKGFTLIELLAVIVILGIIAAIAIPSVGGIIQKSKEDAVKSDAIQILNAAKTYVAANGVPTADLSQSDLGSYIDDSQILSYTVKVTEDSSNHVTYAITTSGITAGKATLTFTAATISDINNDHAKGTREIK